MSPRDQHLILQSVLHHPRGRVCLLKIYYLGLCVLCRRVWASTSPCPDLTTHLSTYLFILYLRLLICRTVSLRRNGIHTSQCHVNHLPVQIEFREVFKGAFGAGRCVIAQWWSTCLGGKTARAPSPDLPVRVHVNLTDMCIGKKITIFKYAKQARISEDIMFYMHHHTLSPSLLFYRSLMSIWSPT